MRLGGMWGLVLLPANDINLRESSLRSPSRKLNASAVRLLDGHRVIDMARSSHAAGQRTVSPLQGKSQQACVKGATSLHTPAHLLFPNYDSLFERAFPAEPLGITITAGAFSETGDTPFGPLNWFPDLRDGVHAFGVCARVEVSRTEKACLIRLNYREIRDMVIIPPLSDMGPIFWLPRFDRESCPRVGPCSFVVVIVIA